MKGAVVSLQGGSSTLGIQGGNLVSQGGSTLGAQGIKLMSSGGQSFRGNGLMDECNDNGQKI